MEEVIISERNGKISDSETSLQQLEKITTVSTLIRETYSICEYTRKISFINHALVLCFHIIPVDNQIERDVLYI